MEPVRFAHYKAKGGIIMAFLSRKSQDRDQKKRAEQPKINRGHALTEDPEGFKDLYWS